MRCHYGAARAPRQLLADASSTNGRRRIGRWRAQADVFVYFNNDWEGFAVHNAMELKARLAR